MKQTTDFSKMKKSGEKIAMVTAYDFPQAKLAEEAGVDMLLVGDSLGMVVLGYDSTIPVTLQDMIHHTKAVKRGAKDTFIVSDLPFMTYHVSKEDAFRSAAALLQEGGAHAVKVEGGGDVINIIKSLTLAGVPVMAHLGLTPQAVGVLGGYKVQGKSAEAANELINEAIKCQEAGAFGIVLECIPKQLASLVSSKLDIPTIGIGAGNETDGQVLVYHDLLTFGVNRVPKFVKQYGDINTLTKESIQQYVAEVKNSSFPEEKHSFTMNDSELELLYGGK
ncbi:3-methyl-2-oxobutanoate hydroxymethyltransferase [Lederbergia wuyishanensis]|uniref:3-methyl-2-oxobutanoate hydroxymethyltransferase n=1 Tax=Lederbergia wuyishanensis TaxID=1347903 RepID=A0ABU0D0V5_9BACI|nr:3-methyl-2-oxobutanoate hydroxymethyltransferase [Lederbergia wuyishanensis]MCJ8006654.1 3-methyl-2-oxobutanoate hydroxymethyltransferase [Lederbergia wuyishanensis]MDQ0342036.1 3-methyl-2-oxobutanoate hydroxymethyltransferase [Lederbergia wuyishanensis]